MSTVCADSVWKRVKCGSICLVVVVVVVIYSCCATPRFVRRRIHTPCEKNPRHRVLTLSSVHKHGSTNNPSNNVSNNGSPARNRHLPNTKQRYTRTKPQYNPSQNQVHKHPSKESHCSGLEHSVAVIAHTWSRKRKNWQKTQRDSSTEGE